MHRIKKMAPGPNKHLAPFAFGLGMTIRQFKTLPIEKQREAGMPIYASQRRQQSCRLIRWKGSRVKDFHGPGRGFLRPQMADLGRKLLQVKQELPHGHFRIWVEDKSGITYRRI
ncbi:hypothetical protein [Pararhizobium sp. LjRoot238]|uniref:hypothetical protein n=1 Tax=Pararhizobium sp. LjRoot238 TaxID=3342293 RepID=UPI003ED0A7C3